MKISGACVKASLIRGFVLPQIGFYEDFRLLRQKLLDVTQHMVMSLPGNLRHLQAGDGGDREGPAKKAPCGWLGHAHRAEDKTVERPLAISGLGAARAAWSRGGEQRQCVHDMEPLVHHVRPAEEQARQR